jgi:hypothetical protein
VRAVVRTVVPKTWTERCQSALPRMKVRTTALPHPMLYQNNAQMEGPYRAQRTPMPDDSITLAGGKARGRDGDYLWRLMLQVIITD